MRCADFHYELPAELIAQTPLAQRSASRLLCLDGSSGRYSDHLISELPELLAEHDLLIFNDTRVVAARVFGHKGSGGRVEILLERPLQGPRALVQLRSSKTPRADTQIETEGGAVSIIARRAELWEIETPCDALTFFERHGTTPLPPYIRRPPDAADRERYQSVFARVPGAVAAPTASLHFDQALLARLSARGVAQACVTLHVGAGTFQPLRVEDTGQHVMHAERYEVSAVAVAAIGRARGAGGRVIAVGTTAARALESAARTGVLAPASGETALFIVPGYRFRVVDALLTNFHLPESTLLMLVAAIAGREAVLAAYHHAVHARYRFFSYGDAMLLSPAPGVRA